MISPRTGEATACSRDSLEVESDSPASSGRSPAYTPITSSRVSGSASSVLAWPQQVVDVGLTGRGMGPVQRPVGVGGADDPLAAPGDDEQQALLGPGDQAGAGVDPVARHHQVDALGRPHPELAAAAEHLLQLVDPDPGRVDRSGGPDVELGRPTPGHGPGPRPPGRPRAESRPPGYWWPPRRRSGRRSGRSSWCAGRRRPGPRRRGSRRGRAARLADGNDSRVLRRPRCRRWFGTPRPAPITS